MSHFFKCQAKALVDCPLKCYTEEPLYTIDFMQDHLENYCTNITLICLFCKDSFLRGSSHDCNVQKVAYQVYELNLTLNKELTAQVKTLSRVNERMLASEE